MTWPEHSLLAINPAQTRSSATLNSWATPGSGYYGAVTADRFSLFERGPDELKDLPTYFGKRGRGLDLTRHDMRIFAEIVDASALSIDAIIARAASMRAAGADVIDLGCLPDTPFPHLEDAVRELKARGFAVSVDSANPDELHEALLLTGLMTEDEIGRVSSDEAAWLESLATEKRAALDLWPGRHPRRGSRRLR